jgi:hypothetical protein
MAKSKKNKMSWGARWEEALSGTALAGIAMAIVILLLRQRQGTVHEKLSSGCGLAFHPSAPI